MALQGIIQSKAPQWHRSQVECEWANGKLKDFKVVTVENAAQVQEFTTTSLGMCEVCFTYPES